ncbi:hypothetical protein MK489_13345 [Myxococcota bacterium]|nr:hypothetical protein [Myxococcota bacterium]
MSEAWKETLRTLHASPAQVVIAATGGGSRAISELLAVPGASATLLEAIVPYAEPSLKQLLGRSPDQACSPATALALASASWLRASKLADEGSSALVGVGCTAALTSDRPKRGAHRVHVASQTPSSTQLYSLELERGERNRDEEEDLAAALVLYALSRACSLSSLPGLPLVGTEQVENRERQADPKLAAVWTGRSAGIWALPDGLLTEVLEESPRGLLSGSFDPLHAGHEALRHAAEQHLSGPVYWELTLRNADKPPLDYLTVESRRAQFDRTPLLLTHAANFVEKAENFPDLTFVVGIDTALRITDPRFYDGSPDRMHEALETLRARGSGFLVAGRRMGDEFQTLPQITIPSGFEDLFEELPEAEFRSDLSSSELRRNASGTE